MTLKSLGLNFDLRFWLLTLGLLLVWTFVAAYASPLSASSAAATLNGSIAKEGNASALNNGDKELKNERNCKALCEHCGCLGFYCGEECICECNNENSDTECIATMQSNARKLAIPFEILIQGPSANRFVRNALQFEQNAGRKGIPAEAWLSSAAEVTSLRNKRSTVVIYKPAAENSLDIWSAKPSVAGSKKSFETAADGQKNRHKRSIVKPKTLEWFNDQFLNIVRPSPRQRQEMQQEAEVHRKRQTPAALDTSWFMEPDGKLLMPAPLFKLKDLQDGNIDVPMLGAIKNVPDALKDFQDGNMDVPMLAAIKNVPDALQGALSNIRDAALTSDFSDALRIPTGDWSEMLQMKKDQNFDFLPRLRNNMDDVLSMMSMRNQDSGPPPMAPPADQTDQTDQAPPTPPPPADQPDRLMLPWLRPMRFLRRVQQVIRKK